MQKEEYRMHATERIHTSTTRRIHERMHTTGRMHTTKEHIQKQEYMQHKY